MIDVKTLHPLEIKTLLAVPPAAPFGSAFLVEKAGLKEGQANQALSWLAAKALVSENSRVRRTIYEITELGRAWAETGTPEERILEHVGRAPVSMPELVQNLGLEQSEAGSAFGQLSKEKVVTMDAEKHIAAVAGADTGRLTRTRALLKKAAAAGALEESAVPAGDLEILKANSKKRGAAGSPFKLLEREDVLFSLTPEGGAVLKALVAQGLTGEEIGQITPEILKSGEWRTRGIRGYAVESAPLSRVLLGRRNPYQEFLDETKDKLVSLGFEEFDGDIVQTEFWNSDALFMPQFHSARDIHDVYYVDEPRHAKSIEEPYLSNVAAAHENGWSTGSRGWEYGFDRDFTRRLILRSQGTVMSARQLHKARVPGKYFGIMRCFRYDQVDATHLADFYQTEGIVLSEDVNLRTLLGLLEMFAKEVAGATDIRYVPGYFPFTEPSIEVHIKHPVLGWFELGGSGIFRPEVTAPMGIKVPVLAWGLGIDRMAMMHLGISDIRELFTTDVEKVRLRKKG